MVDVPPEVWIFITGWATGFFMGSEALSGLMWIWHHLPVAGHAIIHVITAGVK